MHALKHQQCELHTPQAKLLSLEASVHRFCIQPLYISPSLVRMWGTALSREKNYLVRVLKLHTATREHYCG